MLLLLVYIGPIAQPGGAHVQQIRLAEITSAEAKLIAGLAGDREVPCSNILTVVRSFPRQESQKVTVGPFFTKDDGLLHVLSQISLKLIFPIHQNYLRLNRPG